MLKNDAKGLGKNMYVLQYDFVALLLNIINLTVFIYFKNLRDSKSKVLYLMLINSLVTTALDILSAISLAHPERYPYWYSFLVTNIYYLLNNNRVYIYIVYVLLLTGAMKRFPVWKKHIITFPYILTTIMILLNPFTRQMFDVDADLVYQRGAGLAFLYVIAFASMLYWSLYAVRYMRVMKTMDRFIIRSLPMFILVFIIGLFLQTLFPQYLLQSLGAAYCELVLIMVLQNRNELIDGTTQMYNRKAFYDRIRIIFSTQASASITLIMLEDTTRIGYTLGYAYLKTIFQKVARFIRDEIYADERFFIRDGYFALLSINHHDRQYFEMREKIAKRFIDKWDINDLNIKLSAGICQLRIPEHIKSYSDVYNHINQLIMVPHSTQKDRQSGISEISFSKYKREQQVRKAITVAMVNQSFEVYYQPIYSVKDKRYLSAEALARLKDPELGFISPDEFIPLTERDGTITKLGMQIFEMVCSFLKNTALDMKGMQYVEVNLSAVQCMQKNFQEQLLSLMRKYQINPEQICLEITETVTVNSPEYVCTLFQEMDKQGVLLALDDYGSGYSNVNYILELPFHFVKLDKQFIWNAFKDDNGRVMLESTIAMIKSLNMEMIAEGVETSGQAEILKKLGVNYLQGYYFSKPLPPKDFIEFIIEKNAS